MNSAAACLSLGILGGIAGVLSQRARASGGIALVLPLIPGAAIWLGIGRG